MGSFSSERNSLSMQRDVVSTIKEYTDKDHLVATFADMKELLDSGEFCDISLKVEHQEIKAHRIVLASSSPYFRNMFNAQSLATVAKVIDLPQQNFDSIKTLINFIYTGKIELNLDIVEELYNAASFLQLERVKNICAHFLHAILSAENCLTVWNIADNIALEDIQKDSKMQSITFMESLLETETFLNLSGRKLEDLLKGSSVQGGSDKLFKAVMSWVKHDLEKRKAHLGQLLQHIPAENISRGFLRTAIMKEPLLTEDLMCMNWMHKIFISLFDNENSRYSIYDDLDSVAHSYGRIYICSWRVRESLFYRYNPSNSELVQLPARPQIRYCYPILYQNSIYLTGGLVDSGCSSECNRFNLNTKSWDTLELDCNRYYHGACVMNNNLFIVGGCKDLQNLNTVNIYDFNTAMWRKGPDMFGTRKFLGISVHEGCIYVAGGVADKPTFSSSVERLDPREGIWHTLPRLNRVSGACSTAIVQDLLYCSSFRTGVTERFEPRFNRWEDIADASGLSGRLVSAQDELYRIYEGGIFKYGAYENSWNKIFDIQSFPTELVALAD